MRRTQGGNGGEAVLQAGNRHRLCRCRKVAGRRTMGFGSARTWFPQNGGTAMIATLQRAAAAIVLTACLSLQGMGQSASTGRALCSTPPRAAEANQAAIREQLAAGDAIDAFPLLERTFRETEDLTGPLQTEAERAIEALTPELRERLEQQIATRAARGSDCGADGWRRSATGSGPAAVRLDAIRSRRLAGRRSEGPRQGPLADGGGRRPTGARTPRSHARTTGVGDAVIRGITPAERKRRCGE